jgi:hypothetical protein
MFLPQFSQQGAASELHAVQTTDNRNGVSNGWDVVGKFSVETNRNGRMKGERGASC